MENKAISISTTELPNGIYFIHLMDSSGEKVGSKKDISQSLIIIKGRC